MKGHSIWTYPWDIHDIGVDQVLRDLAKSGADTVSLATSYHAGKFLQPGNPKRRVYFPQDGTVYYTVDPERWKNAEIKPLQAEIVSNEGDYLREMVDRRNDGGPKVSCWTVCLHNTRLGLAHPEHVIHTAHGDPLPYGLCPSSPAVRAYVTGMVAEISETYVPDRIELESPDFMGFDHGYHHEKDGLGLLPEDTFLLGLCFCQHCATRAAKAGVDVLTAKQTVRALLDASFEQERPHAQFPDFPERSLDALIDHAALFAYLKWRYEPVTSLIQEIRAATYPSTSVLLIDDNDSWWRGVDLRAVTPHCDGIVHCAYTTELDQIAPDLQKARKILGDRKTLIAGFQLFHPEISGPGDLSSRINSALTVADGCNYYNIGLVPKSRLQWLRDPLSK